MLISFTVEDEGYFITKLSGDISDEDYIHAYRQFYKSDSWNPSLNEIVDLSNANLEKVTEAGMKELSLIIYKLYEDYGVALKMAIYAADKLPRELALKFQTIFKDLPQEIGIFNSMDLAKSWVEKVTKDYTA